MHADLRKGTWMEFRNGAVRTSASLGENKNELI